MNKLVNYRICEEYKLIIEIYSGQITFSDIIKNKQNTIQNLDYKPNYNLLLDFRKAHIENPFDEIGILVEFLKSNPSLQAEKRVAYLTTKPNEVVLTTLFKLQLKDIPIKAETFYTTPAAINWLGNTRLSENQLDNFISEMAL